MNRIISSLLIFCTWRQRTRFGNTSGEENGWAASSLLLHPPGKRAGIPLEQSEPLRVADVVDAAVDRPLCPDLNRPEIRLVIREDLVHSPVDGGALLRIELGPTLVDEAVDLGIGVRHHIQPRRRTLL